MWDYERGSECKETSEIWASQVSEQEHGRFSGEVEER